MTVSSDTSVSEDPSVTSVPKHTLAYIRPAIHTFDVDDFVGVDGGCGSPDKDRDRSAFRRRNYRFLNATDEKEMKNHH